MFTGIIEALGQLADRRPSGGDLRLRVRCPEAIASDVQLGDSVATNGVCLTVTELTGDGYWADVSRETLDKTTAGQWAVGQRLNLERALTPTTRLGGHIVSGHVDGVGEVIERYADARSERFRLRAPEALARYIAAKGSIAIDGTSLTVNAVSGAEFEVNIVPHTLKHTVMGDYRPGAPVNLEVDVLARHLERLLQGGAGDEGLSLNFLREHGFYQG